MADCPGDSCFPSKVVPDDCFENLHSQVISRMFLIQDVIRAAHQNLYKLTLSLEPMNSYSLSFKSHLRTSLFKCKCSHPTPFQGGYRDFSQRKRRKEGVNWKGTLADQTWRMEISFSPGKTCSLCTFMPCESVKPNPKPKPLCFNMLVK